MRIASAVTVAAVLVGGLTACNGKSGSGNTANDAVAGQSPAKPADQDPKAVLIASAAVMEKAGSAKLTISGLGPKQDGAGTGSDIWKQPQAFEATVKVGSLQMSMISVDGTFYLKSPAAPNAGKKWLKFDSKAVSAMSKAGTAGNSPVSGAALDQQLANPVLMLAASAQGGKLTKVGLEQVNGGQALHIKSTIQSDALVAGLSGLTPEQQDVIKAELKQDGSEFVLDFWINSKSELVQEKFDNGGGNSQDSITIGYSDFGSAPAVTAPSAAEVQVMPGA